MAQTLNGSCACRRNTYTISIPGSSPTPIQPQILIDTSAHSRAIHASPIPLLLRFPTPWLTSHTTSFFPDETHQSIRRTYSSPFSPNDTLSSVFCGYCGTQLWRWDSADEEAEQWVCVTVGSLNDGEVEKYFGNDHLEEDDEAKEKVDPRAEEKLRGAEWFEDLLGSGSGLTSTKGALGRIARLGVRERGNSRVVEWEIVEWNSGDTEEGSGSAKRKIGDVSLMDE